MNQLNKIEYEEEKYNKPKIYIACLASYNAGVLHGEWITPETDKDDLQHQINKMLSKSQSAYADEWAVHDYDLFYNLGEYPNLDDIIRVQEAYENHTGGFESVNAFLENWSVADLDNLDEALITWGYESFQEFADIQADELLDSHDIPQSIRSHFDYKSYANDLEHDYYYFDSRYSGTLIFNKNW